MKVAIEGCCHGELDKIYETLQHLETMNNIKVDLLLICGDFQAVRNRDDLKTMAVPPKYQKLNTFYKYYSGEKVAPVLTVFIGGNHEASNFMQELPYGGWVAKNIYYMGYANVIQVGGLRIGGLSGIYKERDFYKGHYEHPPYTEETKRSVYHVRNIEVFRLKQLTRPIDIFLSHDWPTDIARYGNMDELFRRKSFLREEVLNGSLGSPPAGQLLHKLQPSYWFSAHLHVKYTATVQHSSNKVTRFLSLDKCLPRRQFLQVLDMPGRVEGAASISLDPEWLCVLRSTNHLMHLGRSAFYMPGPQSSERSSFEVTDEDIGQVTELFGGDLSLPDKFKTTGPTLEERNYKPAGPPVLVNPQTALLCTVLDLTDPNAVHLGISNHQTVAQELGMDPRELAALDDSEGSDGGDSSTVDTSYCNSSLDMSDSFSSPYHRKPDPAQAASLTPPKVEVDDDDDEFRAILVAQRRKSQVTDTAPQPNGNQTMLTDGSGGVEGKTSLPSSPKVDSVEDEVLAIMAAKKQSSVKLGVSDTTSSEDKSSSDIDTASQDSQEETDRSQSQDEGSQARVTDYMEVCSGSASPSGGQSARRQTMKHPSPTNIVAESPSMKKLKRRNVSMYSSSGTEEDPC